MPIDYFYEGANGQTVGGQAPQQNAPPIMEFVSSGEGLQLSLAFMRIKDPRVRKRMLELVKSLGLADQEVARVAEGGRESGSDAESVEARAALTPEVQTLARQMFERVVGRPAA